MQGMSQKDFKFGKDKKFDNNSVYGELKLSSNLVSELNLIRAEVDLLNE